jgi:hypothetical protein
LFEFELVLKRDVFEAVDLAEVAFEDVVGSLVLLESLGVSGGDDLPSEIQVLQPVVVVQSFTRALQVALQVAFGEGLRQQRPELLLSNESVRTWIVPSLPSFGERNTPYRYRKRSYSVYSIFLK